MFRYSESHWWSRERIGDYLPVLSLDEPSFINYAETAGVHLNVSLHKATHVVLFFTRRHLNLHFNVEIVIRHSIKVFHTHSHRNGLLTKFSIILQ